MNSGSHATAILTGLFTVGARLIVEIQESKPQPSMYVGCRQMLLETPKAHLLRVCVWGYEYIDRSVECWLSLFSVGGLDSRGQQETEAQAGKLQQSLRAGGHEENKAV